MLKNKYSYFIGLIAVFMMACARQPSVVLKIDNVNPVVDEDIELELISINSKVDVLDLGDGTREFPTGDESFTYAWEEPGVYLVSLTGTSRNINKSAHDCVQVNVHYDTEKFKGNFPMVGDCEDYTLSITATEFDEITMRNLGGIGVDVTGRIGGEYGRTILIEKQYAQVELGAYVFYGQGNLLPSDELIMEYTIRYLDDSDPALDYIINCKMRGFKE